MKSKADLINLIFFVCFFLTSSFLDTLLIVTIVCAFSMNVHANPCAGVPNEDFVSNPAGDCQDYYICYDEIAHARRCPNGFFFDEARQMCYFFDDVECGNVEDPCYGKHYIFVNRPTGTCTSYYRCEYGVGVPLDCPEGFHFDEANQMCNFPNDLVCIDAGKPTPPTPPPTGATTPDQTAPTPEPTAFVTGSAN
jgi:Chitin binding Peritrophin-A domain